MPANHELAHLQFAATASQTAAHLHFTSVFDRFRVAKNDRLADGWLQFSTPSARATWW
jgi:hypothetical protein